MNYTVLAILLVGVAFPVIYGSRCYSCSSYYSSGDADGLVGYDESCIDTNNRTYMGPNCSANSPYSPQNPQASISDLLRAIPGTYFNCLQPTVPKQANVTFYPYCYIMTGKLNNKGFVERGCLGYTNSDFNGKCFKEDDVESGGISFTDVQYYMCNDKDGCNDNERCRDNDGSSGGSTVIASLFSILLALGGSFFIENKLLLNKHK